jgi:hypothetical protein
VTNDGPPSSAHRPPLCAFGERFESVLLGFVLVLMAFFIASQVAPSPLPARNPHASSTHPLALPARNFPHQPYEGRRNCALRHRT